MPKLTFSQMLVKSLRKLKSMYCSLLANGALVEAGQSNLNDIKQKYGNSGQREVVFLETKNIVFSEASQYVYIKISSALPSEVRLHWYIGNDVFATNSFYVHPKRAIYLFDMSMIRALDKIGKTGYFWKGAIANFGVSSDKGCVIEKVGFSNKKLSFAQEEAPLISTIDYPDMVHLEVTRNCNLKCYMCREGREKEVEEIGVINLDCAILEKMIPFLKNVMHIALFGWGEPLCHPDFTKFIDAVKEIKSGYNPALIIGKPYISFTSNATLLTETLASRIIESGLDEIMVSVDSPNEDNYNFIRKGAKFKNVISNIRMMQDLKKRRGVTLPLISFEFVAMRRNIEELPKMVDLAEELGVKKIIVQYITVVTKGLDNESLYFCQDLTNRIFDETQKRACERNIEILFSSPRFGTKNEPQGYCDDVHRMFYVKAEGEVAPCCVAADQAIGDLNKETSEEIWLGERRRRIVNNFSKGILEGKCKDCYKFTGNDINLRETHIKV